MATYQTTTIILIPLRPVMRWEKVGPPLPDYFQQLDPGAARAVQQQAVGG